MTSLSDKIAYFMAQDSIDFIKIIDLFSKNISDEEGYELSSKIIFDAVDQWPQGPALLTLSYYLCYLVEKDTEYKIEVTVYEERKEIGLDEIYNLFFVTLNENKVELGFENECEHDIYELEDVLITYFPDWSDIFKDNIKDLCAPIFNYLKSLENIGK